jgi:hypothetical protein
MPAKGSTTSGGDVLYEDEWITCSSRALIIRGYYLPSRRSLPKIIPYADIRSVKQITIGRFTGQMRIWGTATPRIWASFDPRRPRKISALVVDSGRFTKALITPDDPDRVREILQVRVRGGA